MCFTHSIATQLPYEVHVSLPVTMMTFKLREGQGSHLPQFAQLVSGEATIKPRSVC